MGCSGCGNKPQPSFPRIESRKIAENIDPGLRKSVREIVKIAKDRPDRLQWFVDGVTKLAKCVTGGKDYSDQEIVKNREACENCEFSTKKDGKLHTHSQCMAPDPAKNNQPCGCFILCKTQVGTCPLSKFVTLSINKTGSV